MSGRTEGGNVEHGSTVFDPCNRLLPRCRLLFLLLPLAPAFAHSALIASSPADGAVLQAAPKQFSLSFNEPVSPLVLKLVRPDGSSSPLDRYALKDATLVIDAPALGGGTHVLVWRIASADGHPVGGSLIFSVGAPSAGGPPDAVAPADRAVQAALWLEQGRRSMPACSSASAALSSWRGSDRRPAAPRLSPLARSASVLSRRWLSVGLQGLDALDLPLTASRRAGRLERGFRHELRIDTATAALLALLGAIVSLELALEGGAAGRSRSGARWRWLCACRQRSRRRRRAALADAAGRVPARCRHRLLGRRVDAACVRCSPPADPTPRPRSGDFHGSIPYPLGASLPPASSWPSSRCSRRRPSSRPAMASVLIAKLVIVATLFALAMRNRWRLTAPALQWRRGGRRPHWRVRSGSRSSWFARSLPSPRSGASRRRRACWRSRLRCRHRPHPYRQGDGRVTVRPAAPARSRCRSSS